MAEHHHPHAHPGASRAGPGAARTLGWAAFVTLGFAGLEAIGGWWTGSLALLSDAGHMLTDGGALVLGAIAGWMAQRPPSQRHSYGLGRAEVLAALVNSGTMIAIAAVIAYEALARLRDPSPVYGEAAAAIAFAGLVLNLAVLRWLSPHRHDMNARAARLHVLGDALGSIAALASGAVIALTGWTPIDPAASLFICLLIAISSIRLARESLHALMEGVPLGLSVEAIGIEMARVEGVRSVHDLHVWTLSGSRTALSAHVVVASMADWERILVELQARLSESFGIDHVTLQPELPQVLPLVRH